MFFKKRVATELAAIMEGAPKGPVWIESNTIVGVLQKLAPDLEIQNAAEKGIAVVVLSRVVRVQDGEARLRNAFENLAVGGIGIAVDKGGAAEASRLLLCAGFSDVRQRFCGGYLLSSGIRV